MLTDLRHTLRTLARSPLFCLITIFTLALGIGVNTAMFSIMHGIALRELPFFESQRLVGIYTTLKGADDDDRSGFSWLEFQELRASQQSFVDLAAYEDGTTTLSSAGGDPERLSGTALTASAVSLFPAPILLGRWFGPEDDKPGAPSTIVLGEKLWRSRFGADPTIVGRQVKVDSEVATVLGVAPLNFRFPETADAFTPQRSRHEGEKRDNRAVNLFGRLKPGVSLEQGRAEITALVQRMVLDHPDVNKGLQVRVRTLRDCFVDAETRLLLGIMLGAVGLVLLIACANVANLLLARTAAREKEIAVRAALGAGRRRVMRLLLTETLVLCVIGAAGGIGVGALGLHLFRNYVARLQPPFFMVFEVNSVALLYTIGATCAACLLAGLYPALRWSRPDLNATLKDGARGSTGSGLGRFTRLMIIGEVAFSCLLLVLSGLTIRSVIKSQTAPFGFQTAGIYSGRVALPDNAYKDVLQQREFFGRLVENLKTRSEIESFGLADLQPTWGNLSPVQLPGSVPPADGSAGPAAMIKAVTAGYFETLGMKLLQGRGVLETDGAESPRVGVISARFAEKFWPGENAIGKSFRLGAGKPGEEEKWITVVGIVPATIRGKFNVDQGAQAYVPYTQYHDVQRMSIFARARNGDASSLAPVLRQVVRGLNEELPVYFGKTLDEMMEEARFTKRLIAWLFGIFGGVAFVLAAVGLYGVMSYSVAQRTQEIGVRVALGATPADVLKLIFRQGSWQLGLGLALGLALAFFGAQLIANILYGVTPRDPSSFLGTVLVLGGAGLFATLVPALRALRVSPVVALRAS